MPTDIKGRIYKPIILIEDEGCGFCPEISTPLSVSPDSLVSGNSLTEIIGSCSDIEDGIVAPQYYYSSQNLSLPIDDENLLTSLNTSIVFDNTTELSLTLYAYMKCEDVDGCIVWGSTSFEVEGIDLQNHPSVSGVTYTNGSCCDDLAENTLPTVLGVIYNNGNCCQ